MRNRGIKGLICAVAIILLAVSLAGCGSGTYRVRLYGTPDYIAHYDDPSRGWYINGYWDGGCLNCVAWVNPFWTGDVMVLHRHLNYYDGPRKNHWREHFKENARRFPPQHRIPAPRSVAPHAPGLRPGHR